MKKKAEKLEELYKDLKRELTYITVENIISNEKYNIRYNPSYQRNYIWNITKAVNLIETVLINGEIPPITVIKRADEIEVIDGR